VRSRGYASMRCFANGGIVGRLTSIGLHGVSYPECGVPVASLVQLVFAYPSRSVSVVPLTNVALHFVIGLEIVLGIHPNDSHTQSTFAIGPPAAWWRRHRGSCVGGLY